MAAVLWDLDGTILDTEELYDAALAAACRKLSFFPSAEVMAASSACHGMTLAAELEWWVERSKEASSSASISSAPPEARGTGGAGAAPSAGDGPGALTIDALEEAFWEEFLRIDPAAIKILPGVKETIEALAAMGVPQALATMSTSREVEAKARASPPLFSILRSGGIATADTEGVREAKPAPDVYLVAAKMIGVDPRKCIVIEDTVRGVGAGVAAGCAAVVAVPSSKEGKKNPAAFAEAGAAVVCCGETGVAEADIVGMVKRLRGL